MDWPVRFTTADVKVQITRERFLEALVLFEANKLISKSELNLIAWWGEVYVLSAVQQGLLTRYFEAFLRESIYWVISNEEVRLKYSPPKNKPEPLEAGWLQDKIQEINPKLQKIFEAPVSLTALQFSLS